MLWDDEIKLLGHQVSPTAALNSPAAPPSPVFFPPAVRIEMDVLVPHDNVRRIVVGSGGVGIAAVIQAARQELHAMWDQTVHLFLQVKVDRPQGG